MDDEQAAGVGLNRHDLQQLSLFVGAQEHHPRVRERRTRRSVFAKDHARGLDDGPAAATADPVACRGPSVLDLHPDIMSDRLACPPNGDPPTRPTSASILRTAPTPPPLWRTEGSWRSRLPGAAAVDRFATRMRRPPPDPWCGTNDQRGPLPRGAPLASVWQCRRPIRGAVQF